MIELGVGADLLRGVGVIVWIVFGAALLLALIKPKAIASKVLWSLLVIALFFGPMIPHAYENYVFKQRYVKAKALFDERCKTAGEKIYRTVEGVEGVLVMKARPKKINLSDQYALDDPYGHDFGGEEYISSFLWGRNSNGTFTQNHTLNTYKFVELENAVQKKISRYKATQMSSPAGNPYLKLDVQATGVRSAKYGVDWADSSTKEDRDQWIAGSSLKIIDLNTGEVIAERIGFMFDRALGDQSGGRSPWTYAEYQACPAFDKSTAGYPIKSTRTREFIYKVLKPKQGE